MEKKEFEKLKEKYKDYNYLKDGSFWVAFILGGGPLLFLLLSKGAFDVSMIVNLVFLLTWTGWVIYHKGENGHLLAGFLVSLIVTAFSFMPVSMMQQKITEKKMIERSKQTTERLNKIIEEMKEETSNRNNQ